MQNAIKHDLQAKYNRELDKLKGKKDTYLKRKDDQRLWPEERKTTANKVEGNVPVVASISPKKTAKMLHHGSSGAGGGPGHRNKKMSGYSFSTTASRDIKTVNLQKNQAIKEYRNAISSTLQALEKAQREPVEHHESFKAQVAKLKK